MTHNNTHLNKLAGEKSPYLLQHQHNPVDWLPWGEEAFEQARQEDKPIFLSIGYSTCHWCHVMERESFEIEAVAQVMNEHFVNIKLDREERPDVDRVYMTFVQATTGSGGWPMSVFLTPDLKPFYGGTYFPPDDRYGRPGFVSLLKHIADAWKNDRARIEESGERVTQALQGYADPSGMSTHVDWKPVFDKCFKQLISSYDRRYGGFGDAPKFPRPVNHDFMHRYFALRGTDAALQTSQHTLGAMAMGGMNDQLGGGFHRYSVDEQWIVSHFEKMLYDQAQLVISYLEMFQLMGDEAFAQTARETLEYVRRDMTHEGGAFFSAEDADSFPTHEDTHKEEGAFYVWTQAEIEAALGENAAIFNAFYNVKSKGNAPASGDPHGEFRGKNILHRTRGLEEIAREFKRTPEDVARIVMESGATLFQIREKRPRPHLDDKIIASWNGLMISAFARAAQVLDEPRYAEAASRAADFIQAELWNEETQTLRRHYREGAADVGAFADDYAALSRGCLDLYEATFDIRHLQWAEQLCDAMSRLFWDEDGGGYFNSTPDPRVLIRMKEDYDGAEPSANSLATESCLRLARLLERDDLRLKAETTLNSFGARISQIPQAMPLLLCGAMMNETPPLHIVVVGARESDDTRALLRTIHQKFSPFKSVIFLDTEIDNSFLTKRLPFLEPMTMRDNRATAYVCRDFACRAPVATVEELRAELDA